MYCELMRFTMGLALDLREHKHRITELEESMTANEQKILNAAQSLRTSATAIKDGIQSLKDKIDAMPNVELEDLSQEFAELDAAVGEFGGIATGLAPTPAGTPSAGLGPTSGGIIGGDGPIGGPMIHGDPVEIPLAGSSGGTDGVVTSDPPQPGTAAPATEVLVGSEEPVSEGDSEPVIEDDEDADEEEI